MAHHQGMSLLALAYLLLDRPMQRRFAADPMLRAADLLLQERVPKAAAPIFPHVAEAGDTRTAFGRRRGNDAGLHRPRRASAGGPSALQRPLSRRGHQRGRRLQPLARSGRHALARRRHARLLGHVLLPARSGQRRTSGPPPGSRRSSRADATRRSSRRPAPSSAAATTRSTRTPKSASRPKTTSSCGGSRSPTAPTSPRTIELTSYAEVVLALAGQDLSHPAFSNLFVQTELVRDRQAILCTRRPRSAEEQPPWMMHLMTVQRHDRRRSVVRNRPDEIHRPRPDAGRPRRDGRQRAAVQQRRSGARSRGLHPPC